tara:strand:+ start:516 stop:665 length:150 start_codon:yes stop_codon:yes gene_type:complete
MQKNYYENMVKIIKKILKALVVLVCMPYLFLKLIVNEFAEWYDKGLKNL